MRRVHIAGIVVVLAGSLTLPAAADMTFSDALDINQNLSVIVGLSGESFRYEHDNPYETIGGYSPVEWLSLAESGAVSAVDLTLKFSGVGENESIRVEIDANGAGWTELGWAQGSGSHTFNLLDPLYGFGPTGGVDGLPVMLRVLGRDRNAVVGVSASATLDSSTLSISVIPVPGAYLLGGLGFALVGLAKWRLP